MDNLSNYLKCNCDVIISDGYFIGWGSATVVMIPISIGLYEVSKPEHMFIKHTHLNELQRV